MKREYYMQSPNGEVFTTANPEYHKECRQLSQKEGKVARQQWVCKELRRLVKPNQNVYCILRSVSRSGMSRSISLFIISKGDLRNITGLAADALGYNVDKNYGINVGGCGMDMGFHLVYNLGMALWPKGTKKPHGTRNGAPDSSGGYALKHAWL